jgi:asparagine synthase (glutamine-hydrolysing)
MCGIAIVAAVRGKTPSVSPERVQDMRDLLTARGPDDAGFWSDGQVHIGHRRLAINTPGHNRQPWLLDGNEPLVLAFNGELYGCDRLRVELERAGRRITVGSDTELLAHAIAEWGADAPRRVRGMFAYVAWLPCRQRLLVARDALGVIPLYLAVTAGEVIIASEPRAILGHPSMPIEPDWASVTNYLNSLRTTREQFTLFAGMECIRPGERATIELDGESPIVRRTTWWTPPAEDPSIDEHDAAGLVRETVEGSVSAHLVSDVPLCALLSGGVDSTIITALALRRHPGLRTFCAGTELEGDEPGDLTIARAVAAELGSDHRSVPIAKDRFLEAWPSMVHALGVPLSTPNEVAIHAVAQALRPHAKVTMSGEGADELFAGYGPPLVEAERWIAQSREGAAPPVEEWHTATFGWVAPSMFEVLLDPAVLQASGGAELCRASVRSAFWRCGDPMRLRTHLDLQRSLNLASLLQRLNTATMLASVEGRTPFADVRVAELAARLPLALHYPADLPPAPHGSLQTATLPRTKRLLRQAFADVVPRAALIRPKASFPLPFERWITDATAAHEALQCDSARTVLRAGAIEFVRTRTTEHWRLAWPVMNLALWLRRWWG